MEIATKLIKKYQSADPKYSQLLMTILQNIGKDIEPLLKRAEKEGKKLGIKPESESHDELVQEDVILV